LEYSHQVSHGKHILCGENVKFEDYAEIHGLCSEGFNFGNNVTISGGIIIPRFSYYGGDLGIGITMGGFFVYRTAQLYWVFR
jgi:hypothetical protein